MPPKNEPIGRGRLGRKRARIPGRELIDVRPKPPARADLETVLLRLSPVWRALCAICVLVAVRVRFRTLLFASAALFRLLRLCTKSAKYRAPENTGLSENQNRIHTFNEVQRPSSRCLQRWAQTSESAALENGMSWASGGGSGIRTHDTVSRIHAFQACAFSHSAIPPRVAQYSRGRAPDNPRRVGISRIL